MNSVKEKTVSWIRIAFFNLLLVAFLGVLMRYKIAFYLPFIDQKHILHAHSHFAFAGWITQALMTLMTYCLSRDKTDFSLKKYQWLLLANLFAAYGMLLSFPFQGYGPVSITFSTLSIIVSYAFVVVYWRDLNTLPRSISQLWYKAALVFAIVSSFGTFALSAMMATKTIHQSWYLASVYFYLHFQYNGWFFFSGMGLFTALISHAVSVDYQKLIFWLFTLACVPAYVLSALWLPLPEWMHTIVSFAAFTQIVAWVLLVSALLKNRSKLALKVKTAQWIFAAVALAVSIKLLLQFGSTFHFLSDLAFGFRPIVIGYLHLVLLGIITLFILGYLLNERLSPDNKPIRYGLSIFIGGIVLNELLLMVQGISGIAYVRVPLINEMLLVAALTMFSGILLVNIGDWKKVT